MLAQIQESRGSPSYPESVPDYAIFTVIIIIFFRKGKRVRLIQRVCQMTRSPLRNSCTATSGQSNPFALNFPSCFWIHSLQLTMSVWHILAFLCCICRGLLTPQNTYWLVLSTIFVCIFSAKGSITHAFARGMKFLALLSCHFWGVNFCSLFSGVSMGLGGLMRSCSGETLLETSLPGILQTTKQPVTRKLWWWWWWWIFFEVKHFPSWLIFSACVSRPPD